MKKNFGTKGSIALALMTTLLLGACAPAVKPAPAPAAPAPAEVAAPATEAPAPAPAAAEPVKFIIPLWNPSAADVLTELDFVGKVKKALPNIDVEIEVLKETDYESTMKIRHQSGELPDLFPLQQKWLVSFKDALMPVDDTDAAKVSLYAAENKVDNKILGIPYTRFGEVVYYHKSIFAEYGLTVPKTWDEFIKVCETIKEKGQYIPLVMGAKDSWVDYPFNEFMPPIVAKNGDYFSTMATMDAPFAKGQPIYDSYAMIQQLYDAKVMGDDPMGIGFDQSKAVFAGKQGAMIAMGEWLLSDIATALNGDTSDISTFILPVRKTETEELITAGSVEEFWCINAKAKHPEEAKALLNFMFNKDLWYNAHINKLNLGPTVKDVTLANPNPVFQEAFNTPNLKYIIYKAGDENFMKIRDNIKFDVKELGVQMMIKSDLDSLMNDLNTKWAAARKQ